MITFSTKFPFSVKLTFSSVIDNIITPIDPLTFEFKLIYTDVVGTSYEVSRIGETYKNCYVTGGELFARFENHKFSKGILRKELYQDYIVTDITEGKNFEKGYWTNVYPATTKIQMI